MSKLKISISQWLSSRRKLFQLEAIFYTSSAIFNFVALASAVYLLFRFQQKQFEGVATTEAYLLVFVAVIIGINGLHYLLTSFFRNRRQFIESDIHDEGLHPIYDQDSIYEILRRETKRAGRYHLPMTLCFVAIDDFEDMLRHNGRKVRHNIIQKFSDLASEVIRSSDYIAHLGNNRFCFLLCHTDLVHAEHFVYRLLVQSQERLELSFSSGITNFRAGETPGEYIKRAQQALTQAHEEGSRKTRCAIGKDDSLVIKSY